MARNSAVGIDIGTHAVHVAHVKRSRGRLTVANFGGLALTPGVVDEGQVQDVTAVGEAISALIGEAGIREKEAYLGVANQRVVVRKVDLPWMKEEELRESLRFQVQEHIPLPVEDAELDFHSLEEIEEQGQRTLRVLVVAAQKDMVAAHVDAVREAGLRPTGVDLNPFAVIRAIGSDAALEQGSEVLIDIGAGVTEIVVHRGGVPEFVRILVAGGSDITTALEDERGLSREDAEVLKQHTDRHQDDSDAMAVITDRSRAFVGEIRNSLDYYSAQMGGAELSQIRLCGGGALLTGLTEALAEATRLPVEVADPFDRWPAGSTVYERDELAAIGPRLVTAIGLGLGAFE